MDTATREKILSTRQFREVTLHRAELNKDERTVPMSFSHGANVIRWWGIEHLNMSPGSVRLNRWKDSPAFLMNHNPDDQRGVILNGSLDSDGVLRGTVKISRNPSGEELLQDITDGIRTKTSVGYTVHSVRELKPEEMTPEQKDLSLRENLPVLDVDDWEPLEGSMVAVGADPAAGVGRSLIITTDEDLQSRIESEVAKRTIHQSGRRGAMPPTIELDPTAQKTPEQLAQLESTRKEEINAIATRFVGRVPKADQLAKDAIELGISVERFRGDIYSRVTDDKPVDPDSEIGMTNKDKKQYRVRNAVLAAMKANGHFQKEDLRDVRGNKIDLTFEIECSEAARAVNNQAFGSVLIPMDMLSYKREVSVTDIQMARHLMQQRDLTVGTATAGGNLVGTNLLAGSFIELLRNKMLAMQLGVQEMFGLVGNVAIPKQTAATGGGWVTEGNAPTEGNLTVGQVTLAPKTYAAYSDYTRQLLLQATPSIDLVLQNDLARVQAIAWDLGVFHGSGAAGQPQGIVGASGVGSVTGTSLAWAGVLEFESDVAAANADIGSMAFVTTPSIRGTLKSRERATNTGLFLCDLNNTMAGYPLFATAQISAQHIIFGVFGTVLVGYWGGLDILVDPYTASNAGTVRTSSFLSGDVAIRHAGAFSVSTNFT